MADDWNYANTVNQQVNPNLEKQNKWSSMVKAVGHNTTGWASSKYTIKKVSKKVNGKTKTTYETTTPYTVAAANFDLNIPEGAYVKKVVVQAQLKCDKSLSVKAPSAWFMVHSAKGKVTQQTKTGKTGWYNDTYRVYSNTKLTTSKQNVEYVFSGDEWNKKGYKTEYLNATGMGVDLVFDEPSTDNVGNFNVYLSWVRIKVEYELPDVYFKVGSKFRDEENPYLVDIHNTFTIPMEFGNRTRASGKNVVIPIEIPLGMSLVSYNNGAGSSVQIVDDNHIKLVCKCTSLAKVHFYMTLRPHTLGYKNVVASLGQSDIIAYSYARGVSEEYSDVLISSSTVQKAQPSCFNFKAKLNSFEDKVTFRVVVDGEGQSDPNDLSDDFKAMYHNLSGLGNNLVENWSLSDSSVNQGVSIDESLTDNNQVTFNIPIDTDVEINFTGCFIPVTVGDNTLYLTNVNSNNQYTYPYTSYAPKTTVMNIIPDETIWYDHWVTTYVETDSYVIPFVTKESDRVMIDGNCTLALHMEKPQAYIGCVPLPRSHYGPSSDFTNSIISEQYKNKKYMGKSNEIKESIDFKIKLPPREWSTLQGLCELDKPVPVNAVPTAFEGDVLNHRGWVELGGVKNVKKTNPLYYDGELEIEYLTHNINTRFHIIRGKKISSYNTSILNSLMGYVIESGDEFADYVHKNTNGKLVHNETGYFDVDTDGVYIYDEDMPEDQRTLITMDNNQYIRMTSVNPLKDNTKIEFTWFSSKIAENRENNITRIIRLRDATDSHIVLEYEYYNYEFDYDDELYSCSIKCTQYDSGSDSQIPVLNDDMHFAVDLEALNLTVDDYGNVVQEVEVEAENETDDATSYIDPVTGETVELVSEVEVYNDYMYGSTLSLELAGNILSINDSGFNGREVHIDDIELEKGEYVLEVEFMNRNIDSDTADVYHFFDFSVQEPLILSDFNSEYANLVVSSYPLPNKTFVFLRDSEEGMLYYYKNDGTPFTYIQEPFYMYARGVDLKANNNISIFNLNNSYTTFYVQNGLVRIGFNRLNGRVYLSKYDLMSRDYVDVATFQLSKFSNFEIGAYSDDKIEVKVGKMVFIVYRGHPYVMLKHPNDNLQFISQFNQIYADGINGIYYEDYPVMWDLLNHDNLLPDCVGGIDLRASCLEIEPVDNLDVGTVPTLELSQVTETIYDNNPAIFSVTGTVSNIDEEIPIEMEFNGAFGTYTSEIVTDNRVAKSIDLASEKIIHVGETAHLRSKIVDYGNVGVSGVRVDFYEVFNPEVQLKVDKTIVQVDEIANLSVRIIDSQDGSIIAQEGMRVDFYEIFNPELVVGADKSIIQVDETANITATIKDSEDGSIIREEGVKVMFYEE